MYKDKHLSGTILRKVRLDLGLKQKDLKCEGLKNISRIETGAIEMSYTIASRLSDKINQIIKERSLTLDYEIDTDLLMGKTEVFMNDIIYRLKNCENKNIIFEEIDMVLLNLKGDAFVRFILKILKILNEDGYKYAKYAGNICDYSYRLLSYNLPGYNLPSCTRIDVINCLIKAQFIQNQYEAIVGIGKAVFNEIYDYATNLQKEYFFKGMANAYFKLKDYKECQMYLNSVFSFQDPETELFFLSLKAVCKSELGNKDEAIKIYKEIIDKSSKINNFNYVANSYSDIGDLYLKDDLDIARKNINKSIELTYQCTHKQFILNCYYNKFLLSIKEKDIKAIEHSFDFSMNLAKELNDSIVKNKLVFETLNYYQYNNLDDEIIEFILLLKDKYNYYIEDSTLIACLKRLNSEKLACKIVKIAQNQ
ncbi:hypothetical protein [Clostridium sp.]|uniref:hypothetical protein n=1 Tax=Clostridium sp. TaxID=1506 RepID=UPI003217D4DA